MSLVFVDLGSGRRAGSRREGNRPPRMGFPTGCLAPRAQSEQPHELPGAYDEEDVQG